MQISDFRPKAFIFDLNGTMINDMEYHTDAWHQIINKDLNKNLSYDYVKKEMYGKNHEVLERIFGKGYFTADEIKKLSFDKEKRYRETYFPKLALIEGLGNFLETAKKQGILMAIGSAAISSNIDFVVDGLKIRCYFDAIVSADDVQMSKPDAETFLKSAEKLGIRPADCIVFEDAPKGVECAFNAGMKCIVLLTTHDQEEFNEYSNILGFIEDFNEPNLKNVLLKW
ncbi:HAD family phosphatase [Pedobacter sp. Leaf176]|uniref:HAD family hydrolase n=1 Tax=Pedobacter sp. Leaf176 TaxID=1736286 RepID=UPI0007005F63|nr:HAD family phosphatase [Pedobacter sp. Leaf176]KQR70981.1 haloacid dehalogenase [Pedobacter sp. Leaf176]